MPITPATHHSIQSYVTAVKVRPSFSTSPHTTPTLTHAQLSALAQLDLASRTPRDKARVIVSAHKILVGALSLLCAVLIPVLM